MIPLTLSNSTSIIDDEGWSLIAPFGEHPKTRVFRDQTASGRYIIREQKYIQVLDHAAADALVARENSLFGTLKRALIGIPIYKGHGDLADHDPKAVSPDREKIKLGVVDRIRKTTRGIEALFALDADGAAAVAAGWKLPSAFWWVKPLNSTEENEGNEGVLRVRPFKLISVALTQFPNIPGVESLSNSKIQSPSAREIPISTAATPAGGGTNSSGHETTTPHTEPDMKLIAGWLIGQGAALANAESPTETQVLEAMKTVLTAKTGEVTALGNENSTLAGQLAALTNERDALKHRADEAAVTLANEQTARQAERHGRAVMAADLAIQRGKLAVARRDETVTALENSADFDTDAKALLAAASVVKIAGQDTETGKVLANDEPATLQREYDSAFQTELTAAGQDPVKAHRNIMSLPKYAGLAAKFVGQKP